ncbi:sugar (and other) transporter family protein [Burkholderia cenocepacia]|uniref:Sugar (And other) transporter family protein n=1 Tax=Burkholderia cenocepacia TaxID=95486 RepID=A0AAN0RWD1_9BURK|nr:sugar (and other) transporter family protein [Burkholderia cenocepacia]
METEKIDVGALIDTWGIKAWQIGIIAICMVVTLLDGFDQFSLGFVAPAIKSEWQLSPQQLSYLFTASLLASVAGVLGGPLADRVGRRWLVIGSTASFGLFTLLSCTATSAEQFFAWRMLTGLGLGAAVPNTIALCAEISPKRVRSTVVVLLICAVPFGAALAGFASSQLQGHYGWRSLYIVGGVFPLLAALLLIGVLPESIRMLALRGTSGAQLRIRATLRKINAHWNPPDTIRFYVPEEGLSRNPVASLFEAGRASGTVALWLVMAMNLLEITFLGVWLPSLILRAGLDGAVPSHVTSVMLVGATIGSVLVGRIVDRFGTFSILVPIHLAGAAAVASMGLAMGNIEAMYCAAFMIGLFVNGGQGGADGMVTAFYPTSIRSTGISWALGAGRLASIGGPLLGGLMLSAGLSTQAIFMLAGIPVIVSALTIQQMWRRASRQPEAKPAGH